MFLRLERNTDRPEAIYQHTQIQIGAIALIDYNLLVKRIEVNDELSVKAESYSPNSTRKQKPLHIWLTLQKRWPENLRSNLRCNKRSTYAPSPTRVVALLLDK